MPLDLADARPTDLRRRPDPTRLTQWSMAPTKREQGLPRLALRLSPVIARRRRVVLRASACEEQCCCRKEGAGEVHW